LFGERNKKKTSDIVEKYLVLSQNFTFYIQKSNLINLNSEIYYYLLQP